MNLRTLVVAVLVLVCSSCVRRVRHPPRPFVPVPVVPVPVVPVPVMPVPPGAPVPPHPAVPLPPH